ncbi:hypothetical protein [Streptomyces sp. NPDC091215]|uniref:hypothetical protein n=1 Tax=Streptomyces sp. NPDC091215 TaxID=3155192 RepID=UPI0034212F36
MASDVAATPERAAADGVRAILCACTTIIGDRRGRGAAAAEAAVSDSPRRSPDGGHGLGGAPVPA